MNEMLQASADLYTLPIGNRLNCEPPIADLIGAAQLLNIQLTPIQAMIIRQNPSWLKLFDEALVLYAVNSVNQLLQELDNMFDDIQHKPSWFDRVCQFIIDE